MKSLNTLSLVAMVVGGLSVAVAPQTADAGSIDKIEMQKLVVDEARKMNFPVAFALGLAEVSSDFDDTARGYNGAFGLMQVTPHDIKNRLCLYEMDMWSSRGNVRAGLIWMSHLLVHNGSKTASLLAYRASSDPSEPKEGRATNRMTEFRDMVIHAELRYLVDNHVSDNDRSMSVDGGLMERAKAIVEANPSRCQKRGSVNPMGPQRSRVATADSPTPPMAARMVDDDGRVGFSGSAYGPVFGSTDRSHDWRSW